MLVSMGMEGVAGLADGGISEIDSRLFTLGTPTAMRVQEDKELYIYNNYAKTRDNVQNSPVLCGTLGMLSEMLGLSSVLICCC